jgi:hypothetical protein
LRKLHDWSGFSLSKFLFLVATLAVLAAGTDAREQVVIQKGTNGNTQLRGGSLFMDEGAATTSTNTQLNVKAQTGARQRSYVLFDLSALPTIAVKAATLTLHVKTAPSATRTYGVHNVTAFSTLNANWTNRAIDSQNKVTAWGAPGGDFDGTATNTQNVTTASTTVAFTLTGDAQNWYDGTANYGTLIKDENEGNGNGNNVTTIFNSFSDTTVANRPALTLTYLQNVQNLTATPGNGTVTLNWTYPTTTNNLSGESYAGVIILRRAGAPVDKNSVPTDTQGPPALCTTIGSGTLVFVGTMSNTSFADNGVCGALTNGTQYFYKVFLYDNKNYYSSNVVASTYTAETSAVPGTNQTLVWTIATHSYNLGGGGLIPGTQMDFGSDTSQLFSINLANGQRAYPAVALGGTVSARPPILDPTVAANGLQVAYVSAQDGNVYAIDTSTTGIGQIVWLTNLSAAGTAGNVFMGGAGVQVKQYSGASYTPTYDTVFVGTHNSSTTTANSLIALNGSTGAILWTFTGSNANKLDMINSTPAVDYVNNAIWVTSHSNGVTTQPNLWKFNPLNGTVTWSLNLGNAGDIDSSPSLTQNGDVLFVGANNGNLYAVNPAAATSGAALLQTYTTSDGAVKSYPYIVTTTNPYTVVFTTGTMVHAVSFNKNTNTFTKLWDSATFTSPSAPVVFNFSKVYLGTGSDIIYEIDLTSGNVTGQRVVDSGNNPMFIGEPSLDLVLNRIYVTTTTNDQRSYAYSVPFL